MRVSSKSNAGKVAGAVVGLLRSHKEAVLECVGAVSAYKALCAMVITTEFLKDEMVLPVLEIKQEKRNIAGVHRKALILKITGVRNG